MPHRTRWTHVFLPKEEEQKQKAGWNRQRIEDVKTVIAKHQVKGESPLRQKDIDRYLGEKGFEINPKIGGDSGSFFTPFTETCSRMRRSLYKT